MAPPHGVIFAVALIFNLLQRHRSCRVLVDARRRTKVPSPTATADESSDESDSDDEDSDHNSTTATAPVDNNTALAKVSGDDIHADPYQYDSLDFEKCGALQSSLWELKSLERTYTSTVASLMTVSIAWCETMRVHPEYAPLILMVGIHLNSGI